jgi:hypothetical protein
MRGAYNPDREHQTTLLWSEVESVLDSEPFVPQLEPLSRKGYRWTVGLAVMSATGFAASVGLYAMALEGVAWCLCMAMLFVGMGSMVTSLGSFLVWNRMMIAEPSGGLRRCLASALNRWERWALGAALVGTVASIAHFWPMLRAFPKGDNLPPDNLLAGAVFVVVIPVYLFAGIVALEGSRRLRPVEAAGGVVAASSAMEHG